jgi:DNA-binding transcriptional LysR family regulator
MRTPLDSDLLRTFVTIVETESFTASGEKLRRTQPAVSMQMKRLEDAVGKPLFEQTRRGIRLTREGDILLGYARRILALSAEAHDEIDRSGSKEVVRLGTSDDYATLLLPDILRRYAASYPDVQIDLACGNGREIEQKLQDGLVDLALIARRENAISEETIWSDKLVWVGTNGAELGDEIRLALFPPGCVCREIITEALNARGQAWTVAFESDNIGAIHAAVRSGLAVTAVEEALIPDGATVLRSTARLPALASIKLCLTTKARPLRPALEALVRHIRIGLTPADGTLEKPGYAETSISAALP